MNIYYYIFYILYELLTAAKRDKAEWFANLILTFAMSCNLVELYFVYSKIIVGHYETFTTATMLLIFISVFIFNHIFLVGNEKYLLLHELFAKLKLYQRYVMNILAVLYFLLTVIFLFFIKVQ